MAMVYMRDPQVFLYMASLKEAPPLLQVGAQQFTQASHHHLQAFDQKLKVLEQHILALVLFPLRQLPLFELLTL